MKIVQITDLHGSSFGKDNKNLIKRIADEEPHLVMVTGDMFTNDRDNLKKKPKSIALNLMKQLAEKFTVYFVNGEHDFDYSKEYYKTLESYGVHVLGYETENIEINGNPISLYGITNLYYTPTFDLSDEFTLDDNRYNILLAHIANFDAFAKFGVDLSLCGDTHGGQVRLPFIGPVIYDGTWFPIFKMPKDQIYDKGLFEKDGSKLFVSSGLGNHPAPIRFLNRPEVVSITLKPAS